MMPVMTLDLVQITFAACTQRTLGGIQTWCSFILTLPFCRHLTGSSPFFFFLSHPGPGDMAQQHIKSGIFQVQEQRRPKYVRPLNIARNSDSPYPDTCECALTLTKHFQELVVPVNNCNFSLGYNYMTKIPCKRENNGL